MSFRSEVESSRYLFPVACFCFFLSGSTALVYEVIWVRMFTLAFGNTVYAVGAVLSAFMAGLSLGSFLLGRRADRDINLLKNYGALEIGIAAFALLSPELLRLTTSVYISTVSPSTEKWVSMGLKFLLSFSALIIPATLMGGTLPILSRYFIRTERGLERSLGVLYAMNTLGGVAGAFLVGFVLIKHFGLNLTLGATAALNVLVGIVAIFLGAVFPRGGTAPFPSNIEASPMEPTIDPSLSDHRQRSGQPARRGHAYAIVAFSLTGFTAMAYQVSWTRLLVGVIGSATYSFSLILMGVLLGIGLGSLAASYIPGKRRSGLFYFSALQVLIGASGLATIVLFALLPELMLKGFSVTGSSYGMALVFKFLIVLLYILVPATFSGAAFPLIADYYGKGDGGRGRRIGNIYAANTVGCVLGSAVTAFFLIPLLGSTSSIKIASAISIVSGAAGFLLLGRLPLAAAASVLLVWPFLPVDIPPHALDSGVAIYGKAKNYSYKTDSDFHLFLKEGPTATVSVRAEKSGSLSLRINGKVDASTGGDMSTQMASAYFPLIIHGAPESVLVVGFGSGVTVNAVRGFPGVKDISCVEIEPAVFEAADYFKKVNENVHRDPSVGYFEDDARRHIATTRKKYDVIISEPSNPWISGVGNLFSKEFYESAAERLNEGGLFCQWMQIYSIRPEDVAMVLKTFSSVFPEVTVWRTSPGDTLLMGSKTPIRMPDYGAVQRLLRGKVGGKLKAYLHIEDPMDFFSYFVTDGRGVAAITGEAEINTDDRPLLEFNAPLALYSATSTSNARLLYDRLAVPHITGLPGDHTAEFFYRKSANYQRLNIPAPKEWIEAALMRDRANPDYLVQKAKLLSQAGARDKAQTYLRAALGLAPENPQANFELGILLESAEPERARSLIYKAASLKGDEFSYLAEAGRLKITEGKIEEALGLYLKAHDAPHPFMAESASLFRVGICLMKLGRYDEAVSYLKMSLEANPYEAEAHRALAETYMLMGEEG